MKLYYMDKKTMKIVDTLDKSMPASNYYSYNKSSVNGIITESYMKNGNMLRFAYSTNDDSFITDMARESYLNEYNFADARLIMRTVPKDMYEETLLKHGYTIDEGDC